MRKFVVALLGATAMSFAANAADMPVKAPIVKAPVAIPYNWTGFYVGATAGYLFGKSQHCDTPAFCTNAFNVNGFTGGGTVGYNWQMTNWVLGVEADFSGANAKGSTTSVVGVFNCVANCDTKLNWWGTVRGRVGYAADRWLPYVTGGYAYGNLSADLNSGGLSASGSRSGWTLGAGVEYALMPQNWSVKLEYLYFHLNDLFYDTLHICGQLSCTAVHNNFNVARLGVNYRF